MLREDNIPVKNCFNFWFNREKRKEFYTTSISLYKTTFNHNKNNNKLYLRILRYLIHINNMMKIRYNK